MDAIKQREIVEITIDEHFLSIFKEEKNSLINVDMLLGVLGICKSLKILTVSELLFLGDCILTAYELVLQSKRGGGK